VPDLAAITIDGDDGDRAFFDPCLALDREGFFDRESDYVDAADFGFTIYTVFAPGQTLHMGFRLLDADRPGSGRKHSMYILGAINIRTATPTGCPIFAPLL